MSLYGTMRTSVSGMNAQSSRLGSIADNIANGQTVGYKRSETQFSSLVRERPGSLSRYASGGVTTTVRHRVSEQGTLQFTTGNTDLAVQGDGFFMVQSPNGERAMTRAGAFVPDARGHLVNSAGFTLLGQPAGAPPGNGGELVPIDLASAALRSEPSTEGAVIVNLDDREPVAVAPLPSANAAGSEATARTSVLVHGARGEEILLDVHFTRTGTNTTEVAAFAREDASVPGPFPYAAGQHGPGPLAVATLTHDATTGRLSPGSDEGIDVPIRDADGNLATTVALDLTRTTRLAADFQVRELKVDGHAPASIDRIEVTSDGTLRAIYESGTAADLYDIPLATVTAPDRLAALPGNVYAASHESGLPLIGRAETGAAGSIIAGALESSNVDIASELTDMIQSQRSFTANSKVFQTGSELMDVIVNLKR